MVAVGLAYLIVTWLLCAAIVHYASPRRTGLSSGLVCFAAFNVFTVFGLLSVVAGAGVPESLRSGSTLDVIILGTVMFCVLPMFLFVPTKKWPPEPPPGDEIPVCPRCRYDLRGNTTGVCPECGQLFEVVQGAR